MKISTPLLAALFATILFAFAFPATKAVLPYFSAEQVAALRMSALFIFGVAAFVCSGAPIPQRKDLIYLFLLGGMWAAYMLLLAYGIGRVTAGAASMIATTNPVFVSLLASIFLREKLNIRGWCGIGLGVFGVAVISFERGIGGEFLGYLLLVAAQLSIATYYVCQKSFLQRYSPFAMISYTSIAGFIPLVFLLPQSVAAATVAPPSSLFIIATMGLLSSGLAFVLWAYALSKRPASMVTSFLFLHPVFVILLAWFWLQEIPSTQAFIGGAITLCGLGLVLKRK